MLYLKIVKTFMENNKCILYSKLSKELKNGIKIKVGQVVLELLIKTYYFDCFDIHNLNTAWPTKIPMPFCEFLGQLHINVKIITACLLLQVNCDKIMHTR